MDKRDDLKRMKASIGRFYEEVKSNSITELVIWVDCKLELEKERNEEHKKQTGLIRR